MYPGVTCLDALLAFVFVGVLEFDLVCVSAVWTESFHGVLLSGDHVGAVPRGLVRLFRFDSALTCVANLCRPFRG